MDAAGLLGRVLALVLAGLLSLLAAGFAVSFGVVLSLAPPVDSFPALLPSPPLLLL